MLRHPQADAVPGWVRHVLEDDEEPAFDHEANDNRGGWFAIRDNSDDWRDIRELHKLIDVEVGEGWIHIRPADGVHSTPIDGTIMTMVTIDMPKCLDCGSSKLDRDVLHMFTICECGWRLRL